MPTCMACRENVPTGAADGWLTLRRLIGSGGPSQSLGLFCGSKCVAAALWELDPWST